ncbi:unnamed protein product, partial [Effrenium voratum]
MELPVAPIHDSKEALRFRAICDERITLPLSALRDYDSVYTKLVAGLSKASMVEVKVNWRCNLGGVGPAKGGGGLVAGLPAGVHQAGGVAKEVDLKAKVLAGADTTL